MGSIIDPTRAGVLVGRPTAEGGRASHYPPMLVRGVCIRTGPGPLPSGKGSGILHFPCPLKRKTKKKRPFIFKFINNGPTHQIYTERFILLKSLYEDTKNITKSEHHEILYSYNAIDSPAEVWIKLLVPSICETELCDNCGNHETIRLTLMPNHKIIIQNGFGALERALQFYPIIHNKKCGQYNITVLK